MTERDGDPSTLWGFLYRVCSQPGCTLGALAVGSPVIGALLELADPAATVAGLPAYLAGLGAGGAACWGRSGVGFKRGVTVVMTSISESPPVSGGVLPPCSLSVVCLPVRHGR